MADDNNSNSDSPNKDDFNDQKAPIRQSSASSFTKISASKGIPDATPLVAVVFGPSMISNLTDCLQTSATDAISEAVSSLPLLGTSVSDEETTTVSLSGYHKLLHRLQSVYISNLDRFDVYAKRNIFSIPPGIKGSHQMQMLANFFLHASSSSSVNNEIMTTHSHTISPLQQLTQKGMEVPTLDQIPGQDQLQTLEQELEQARIQLNSAQEKGKLLRSHLAAMNKAVQLAETSSRGIKRMLMDEGNKSIHDTIQQVLSDKESLAVMQLEGRLLIDKLDNIKHSSSSNSCSGGMHDLQQANNFKKDSLVDSSKQLVEERCQAFRTQTIRTDEVTNLASLLKRGKK